MNISQTIHQESNTYSFSSQIVPNLRQAPETEQKESQKGSVHVTVYSVYIDSIPRQSDPGPDKVNETVNSVEKHGRGRFFAGFTVARDAYWL